MRTGDVLNVAQIMPAAQAREILKRLGDIKLTKKLLANSFLVRCIA